ncbi:hypothetical protein OHA40_25725 [Nocardia sp. NBC_00508]|uniref:hypothetical protein n=1 Tax=Nocardia sp. NBC_00508 TaxID=2975992 RepID=UPI002E7FCAC4|nr:hypothetical protein [Nocardia sp. NBC_00508]WUD65034.1 hypothetical protein OHA40_25725 [Nocardia sp. NBC_00508]
MTNFSADLNQLVAAARAWRRASDCLGDAAHKADSIRYSNRDVVWALFQEAWNAQATAAKYMYDRLSEGRDETDAIGDVLEHVANVYMEQDQNFANVLIKMDEG